MGWYPAFCITKRLELVDIMMQSVGSAGSCIPDELLIIFCGIFDLMSLP